MADPIGAELVRVELFEDRAAITRRVALPSGGRHQIRIGPLTPLVSERALSFPGGTLAAVEEVSVERVGLTREEADPEKIEALVQAKRDAQDKLSQAADALTRAKEHAARMRDASNALIASSPRAVLEQDAVRWLELAESFARARMDADMAATERQIEHERCALEHERLSRALTKARAGKHVLQGFLLLGLHAEAATELLVRYVVPCAMWRPTHRAELVEATPALVRFTTGAMCWNATGEDWREIELVCSTARPGDLASPPALLDDTIEPRKRDREVVVEAREETIQVARESDGKAAASAPGVDDGGEPRTFTARGRVTLPSDGRPVAVELEQWSSEAESCWLALPERSSAAVRRTTQRNGSQKPLLAGPVSLIRGGLSVGRGQIGLVAPGERFSLGWGSHDGVRITRRRDHKVDRTRITGYQRHEFTVQVRVVHLGDEPVELEVRERVPVSELSGVTVTPPRPSPPATPDRDGFLKWSLSLAPGEQRDIELSYAVEAGSNVRLPF